MAHDKELEDELKKLEEGVYGKPAEEQATIAEESDDDDTGNQPTEEVIVEEPVESVEEEPVATPTEPVVKQEEDWENRFKSFKASSDATVHGLRQQIVSFKEAYKELQDKYNSLSDEHAKMKEASVDPYENLFTDEEKDLIGEETIAALKKANEAAIKAQLGPIQDQLSKERDLRMKIEERSLKAEKAAVYQKFLDDLAKLVPEYASVDSDEKFLAWMEEPDPYAGYSRKEVFKNAQHMGDVKRVADYFLEWIEKTKPVDRLARKITPSSTGSTTAVKKQSAPPTITPKFIDKFFDDVLKGRYRGREKEQLKIEQSIDNHLRKLAGQV